MFRSPEGRGRRVRPHPPMRRCALLVSCLLLTGLPALAGLPDPASLSWPAANPEEDCDVAPLEIEFGPTALLETETRYYRVINHGATVLTLTPTTDDPVFTVDPGPIEVAPGDTVYSWITFRAAVSDTFRATVDLGPEICSPVACVGLLDISGAAQENVVGITFDPSTLEMGYCASTKTAWPYSLVTAHLVLMNPSVDEALAGWECCLTLYGDAQIASATLPGQPINVLEPPCYMVGLGVPLPPAPYHVLAELSIFVLGMEEDVNLALTPLYYASIPGEMAWLTAGEGGEILPMSTALGYPEVAYITRDPASAVGGPAPRAASRILAGVPNPFNPRTEIRFELEAEGRAKLRVYDLTGLLVRTLVDETLEAGPHGRTWYGRDDVGRRVASGTYTVRLETASGADRIKVTLVK